MKYSSNAPLLSKGKGPLHRNKSGLLMSPFNLGPCVNKDEPNPKGLPLCNVPQVTSTTRKGTQNGVTGTFTDTKSITHQAIDANKPEIPASPNSKPGDETPPKIKPPSKNQCGKDVDWSDSRCQAYAKKRGGKVVDGKYIPGKKKEPVVEKNEKDPATTKRTYTDETSTNTTFVADPKKEVKNPGISLTGKSGKKSTGTKLEVKIDPQLPSLGGRSTKGSGCPSGKKCRGATNKPK